jgi:hypothetical protein
MMASEIKATVDIGQILTAALMLIAQYKQGRDRVVAAGDPNDQATGQVKTDAELIELFRLDAAALVAHVDDLLAKYRQPPADPAG